MANIVPGSAVALEGMPPTDGLLAGVVCLSPTLAPLRDAVVAHVVRNMEDEGQNIYRDWILYSISLPSFLLSLQKTLKATLWTQEGLRKRA